MFNPLLAQQNDEADAREQNSGNERQPPKEGHDPSLPGDDLIFGQAFVKPANDLAFAVVGREPRGNDTVKGVCPTVFGCGIIKGRGDGGEQGAC